MENDSSMLGMNPFTSMGDNESMLNDYEKDLMADDTLELMGKRMLLRGAVVQHTKDMALKIHLTGPDARAQDVGVTEDEWNKLMADSGSTKNLGKDAALRQFVRDGQDRVGEKYEEPEEILKDQKREQAKREIEEDGADVITRALPNDMQNRLLKEAAAGAPAVSPDAGENLKAPGPDGQ